MSDTSDWQRTLYLSSWKTALTHSFTHLSTHSYTHSLTHPLTHSFTHSSTHSLIHPLTHSLTHLPTFTHPPSHFHSLIHWLTHSLTHPLTQLPTHPNMLHALSYSIPEQPVCDNMLHAHITEHVLGWRKNLFGDLSNQCVTITLLVHTTLHSPINQWTNRSVYLSLYELHQLVAFIEEKRKSRIRENVLKKVDLGLSY